MKDRRKYNKLIRNSFCPTGPGGGVDPTCGAYSVSELNDAIQDYGELSHEQVNDHMRLTKRFKGVAASDARDTANKIAAAFHTPKIVRTTAKTEIVHRGIGNNRVYQSMRKLKVGDVVSDKAFLSTSKSPDIAQKAAEQNYSHQIIMRIVLPKGTKYLAGRSDEKELILQSGLPLKITKIDHAAPGSGYKHGTLYIDAEVSKSPRKTTNNVQNLTCNKRSNPLRFDPTRTTTLRRAFVGKIRRKFAMLRKAIYDLLVVEDALWVGERRPYTWNVFCPTGEGGGVDPSCSPSSTFSDHGTTPEEVGDSWSDYGSGFSIKEISKGEVVKAGSTDVNGNRIDAKDVEKYGRIAKALQKVAQTSKSEHSEVWRGIALPVGTDVSSMFPSGKEFTFEGLTATSHDKSIAKNYTDPQYIGEDYSTKVVLKISQRGGVTGYDNNHGELSDGETILPSGAKYRVQGIHKEGDLHVVTMTNDESVRKPAVTKIAPKSSVTSANNPIYADVSQSHVDTIKEVARELAGKKYTGKVSLYGRVNREVYKRSNKGINLSGYKVEAILKDAGITTNTRWRFNTTPEQLEAFKEWLKTQVEYYIIGMSDEQLWNKFIESGFKKGAGRAFDDTKPQLGWTEAEGTFYAGTKDQFLKSAFGQPESLSKVQLLAARTFDELEGMSADMQNKLGRILVDGLTKGNGPISIAREMSNQLNLSMTRAETIARTELIRAHAEGQLVGMEELGVDEVGVMVEWSTAGDDRVCELCEPMEGVVLKIEEARGMIPRHPNCRCAFVPANVAEPTDDQKRGKRKIMSAVRTSAALGKDDFSTAIPVTKERPKSVLPVITNTKAPAPTVVYQFSQLLAGARK